MSGLLLEFIIIITTTIIIIHYYLLARSCTPAVLFGGALRNHEMPHCPSLLFYGLGTHEPNYSGKLIL